jgi:hypothetical protein
MSNNKTNSNNKNPTQISIKNIKAINPKINKIKNITKKTSFIEYAIKKPGIIMGFLEKFALTNMKEEPINKKLNLRAKKSIIL